MVVTTINDGTFNDHRRPHFCGRCLLLTTTFWLLTTTYPIVNTHFSCSEGRIRQGGAQEEVPLEGKDQGVCLPRLTQRPRPRL